jgi:nicotinamide riboside transporter PnuC
MNKTVIQYLRKFNESYVIDVVVAAIIIAISWSLGYQNTKINFQLFNQTFNQFPIGYVSIFAAVLSVLSTRFVSRKNNIGNILGLINIFIVIIVDTALGNQAAKFTYPLSFTLVLFAYYRWKNSDVKSESISIGKTVLIFLAALTLSLVISMLSFSNFWSQNKSTNEILIILISTLSAAFAFTGNYMAIFKYYTTNAVWMSYDVVKLSDSVIKNNTPNTIKYILYFILAAISNILWQEDEKTK